MTHIASDGSVWHISYNPKPIPTSAHDWEFVSDEYGGPPDDCHGTCASKAEAVERIEEWIEDQLAEVE